MADIYFADSETRSECDLLKAGAYKYSRHPSTEMLIWSFCTDDMSDKGGVYSPPEFWPHNDAEPTALLDHVENYGYVAFWNAFFDRNIWNNIAVKHYDWPYLRIEQTLCAQAQAEGNNLPAGLGDCAKALNTKITKDSKGKALIQILSIGSWEDWVENRDVYENDAHMGAFRRYALTDTLAMREVWNKCRPLLLREWEEYHASEHINQRGVTVDVDFAEKAGEFAEEEFADLNDQLREVSGDPGMSLTAHLRKSKWIHDNLYHNEEVQKITRKPDSAKGKKRYGCDETTREAVLNMLDEPKYAETFPTEQINRCREFLEIINAGNSAAVRKFTSMVNMECEGRVRGQYVFNGAGQTGRLSSRGIQIHNLIRAPVDKKNPDRAIDAIEDILAGFNSEELTRKYGLKPSRLLSRLIRTSLQAAPGKVLCWSDWGQFEGRACPWLADDPTAEMKLDLFRSGEDVYKHMAAGIYTIPVQDIGDDSDERQAGKVAELAFQFGGTTGALIRMGKNYGITFSDEEAGKIHRGWMKTNPWAKKFWRSLESAAIRAYENPHTIFRAGRVRYIFLPELIEGTLICELFDGRWISYPSFARRKTTYIDKSGKKKTGVENSFKKGFYNGFHRVKMWYGTQAENATQATNASALRRCMVDLQDILVLTTHDELVAEVLDSARDISQTKKRMHDTMLNPSKNDTINHFEGLPLKADFNYGPYYTK